MRLIFRITLMIFPDWTALRKTTILDKVESMTVALIIAFRLTDRRLDQNLSYTLNIGYAVQIVPGVRVISITELDNV